jgi:hypothetical protein
MDYDDPRWPDLHGGYRLPYDPRKALRSLEANINVKEAWDELYGELYHQGDVGEASYATVLLLARIHAAQGVPDWNTYALAVLIEEARGSSRNPPLPAWLEASYRAAWSELTNLALRDLKDATDPMLVSCAIAAIAVAKGQLALGGIAAKFSEDERKWLLADRGVQ